MANPVSRSAIPLYHQILLALRDEIRSGTRGPGSLLPTEHELAALHGVSRITARRALVELAGQGLVERRRRAGTRVATGFAPAQFNGDINQALESLIAFGRDTRVAVLEHGKISASGDVAGKLHILAGAPVLRALRLRSDSHGALGAVESFVPVALAAGITRSALLRQPLLELLRAAGHVAGGGQQTVSAACADPDLAQLLDCEQRASILCVERVVTDRTGTPMLLTRARYRGDRYRVTVDFQRVDHEAVNSAISTSE